MIEKSISNYHDLHVVIKTQPDEGLISHLKKTILGTPGGLRYRHTDQDLKLKHIGEAWFMVLYKATRMLGSVGFCLRKTLNASSPEKSWYIRYFAIHAPLRSAGKKPQKDKQGEDRGTGILKAVALPYFENPDMLQGSQKKTPLRSIIYSYIDGSNPRSIEFSRQMGFERARTLRTVIYTRLHPKKFSFVQRISEPEKPVVKSKLKEFYAGYTMFHDRFIFFDDNYYLAYENDEMVAGLQANPEIWQIVEMGGISGKLVTKILPRIPGMRKYLNPDNFNFLGVEGIWYKEGKEHYIADIIETVLSDNKLHFAITWMDTGSKTLKDLEKAGRKGILSRFVKTGDGEIHIRFVSFSDSEKMEYFHKPAYLSAFDMT